MRRTTTHARKAVTWGIAIGCAVVVSLAGKAAAERVTFPLLCSTGPSGQRFSVGLTIPRTAEIGSVYEIRIDGSSSGKISQFGLNYIHDMTVDYLLPAGVAYIEGSARIIPNTGTANVLAGARVFHHGGIVTIVLPGKVPNGTDYAPPSISMQVRATGSPGDAAVVAFNRYQLAANAFLVGEVAVSCDPTPKPYPLGTTRITARAEGLR